MVCGMNSGTRIKYKREQITYYNRGVDFDVEFRYVKKNHSLLATLV